MLHILISYNLFESAGLGMLAERREELQDIETQSINRNPSKRRVLEQEM